PKCRIHLRQRARRGANDGHRFRRRRIAWLSVAESAERQRRLPEVPAVFMDRIDRELAVARFWLEFSRARERIEQVRTAEVGAGTDPVCFSGSAPIRHVAAIGDVGPARRLEQLRPRHAPVEVIARTITVWRRLAART